MFIFTRSHSNHSADKHNKIPEKRFEVNFLVYFFGVAICPVARQWKKPDRAAYETGLLLPRVQLTQ